MELALEIENLSKSFGASSFSLENVSLAVPNGRVVGFVGENGAGKTTTINCILNTQFKDSGMIKLFGREMTDEDTAIREEIGVVFDACHFSEHLNAAQLSRVMDGVYSNWDLAAYESYLDRFQIPLNKKIKTFSRGMSTKLSIAVALSHHPRLLILDEATSGLDPIIRDEVLDVFLDFIQEEDHSILISSHITGDLEKIADYIIFIHNGKIILSAKKDELIYEYGVARCKSSQFEQLDKSDIIAFRKRDFQVDVLVRSRREMERKQKGLLLDAVSIDEMMLLLVKGERI